MADNVVDLAARRRVIDRETDYDYAIRQGKQMADNINSGRVSIGKPRNLEAELGLLRQLEALVGKLEARAGRVE